MKCDLEKSAVSTDYPLKNENLCTMLIVNCCAEVLLDVYELLFIYFIYLVLNTEYMLFRLW